MKHGHALIISQTTSAGQKIKEDLQQAGWRVQFAPPPAALAVAARQSFDVAVICGCNTAHAQATLETLKLDIRTTCTHLVLCDPLHAHELAVRVLPDAQVDADRCGPDALKLAVRCSSRCDVKFDVPSECRFIEPLNRYLHRLYDQLDIDSENKHRLTTAVREMVHNAIEWGNRGVADARVEVRCQIETHAVTIRVRDHGKGFDRLELPHAANSFDPTQHLGVRDALGLRAGGFGILMTRGLVDDLSYNEAGNEVCIVKKIGKI